MKKFLDTFSDIKVLRFTILNTLSKLLLAVSQIYIIYICSRLFELEELNIIYLLLGYVIWFQIFEFGLSL